MNQNVKETVLRDLKAILLEARQTVPQFLTEMLGDPAHHVMDDIGGVRGCAFCGGLGHRIAHCPKLEKARAHSELQNKDSLVTGGRYGNEW